MEVGLQSSDVGKLKVTDISSQLQQRGLDTSGH